MNNLQQFDFISFISSEDLMADQLLSWAVQSLERNFHKIRSCILNQFLTTPNLTYQQEMQLSNKISAGKLGRKPEMIFTILHSWQSAVQVFWAKYLMHIPSNSLCCSVCIAEYFSGKILVHTKILRPDIILVERQNVLCF